MWCQRSWRMETQVWRLYEDAKWQDCMCSYGLIIAVELTMMIAIIVHIQIDICIRIHHLAYLLIMFNSRHLSQTIRSVIRLKKGTAIFNSHTIPLADWNYLYYVETTSYHPVEKKVIFRIIQNKKQTEKITYHRKNLELRSFSYKTNCHPNWKFLNRIDLMPSIGVHRYQI